MTRDKLFLFLQVTTVVLFLGLFVYLTYSAEDQDDGFYESLQDSVEARLAPHRLKKLIPEPDLKIDRTDDGVVLYWGWLVSSDRSGSISTQWFKAEGYAFSKNELPEVERVKLFIGRPPTFTNSPPLGQSIP